MLFGRPYRREPTFLFDILERHFGIKKKFSPLTIFLLKLYLTIFGIPDIGFQSRARHFQKLIKSFNFQKVLDAGGGSGLYADYLHEHFPPAEIEVIDKDKRVLNRAQKLFSSQIKFESLDILELKKKNYFDLIYCIDVLEHIQDDEKALLNFSRALKDKGILLIHVPKSKPYYFFRSFLPNQHSQHVREGYGVEELREKIEKLGFLIQETKGTMGPLEELTWEFNWFLVQKTPFLFAGLVYPLWLLLSLFDQLFSFSPNRYNGFFLIAKKQ